MTWARILKMNGHWTRSHLWGHQRGCGWIGTRCGMYEWRPSASELYEGTPPRGWPQCKRCLRSEPLTSKRLVRHLRTLPKRRAVRK